MKITRLLSIMSPLLLVSCGGIKSKFHEDPYGSGGRELPSVSIPVNKEITAVKHSTGMVPMFGGFRAALFIEDASIVSSKVVHSSSGLVTSTIVQGKKVGKTKAYYTNAFYLNGDTASVASPSGMDMIRKGNYFELEVVQE